MAEGSGGSDADFRVAPQTALDGEDISSAAKMSSPFLPQFQVRHFKIHRNTVIRA
jgi:hypothetical protein